MSEQIKQGRKPLSSKRQPASYVAADEIFNNPLSLDPKIMETIESKGYSYRFINYKRFVAMGGQHEAHWVPISRKTLNEWGYGKMDESSLALGSDPDGYIRRLDSILAVRPKSINEKHKAYLQQEANRVKFTQKQHADELREIVRRSGLDARVTEGYEDEESEAS